ncbi:hypothetical protein V2P20_20015 [Methylobacter sp. Wu1]|uniref:hypothetical protein n=1 Tax=Methylobacter sp. Wu1 TaxID=3119359 RepID=UPI002F931057
MTLSAILSASCSNLSPGLFTAIFICTEAVKDWLAGAKKSPPPALAKKGWLGVWVAVFEAVPVDFSELDFIFFYPST